MNKKMLLVTHGQLGNTLIDVASKIIGVISEDAISSISNEGLSLADLIAEIRSEIGRNTESYFILATDFPGGSCFIASKKISSSDKRVSTVSGLNISMVLSFLTKKDLFNGTQLTEVIRTDGTRAIVS